MSTRREFLTAIGAFGAGAAGVAARTPGYAMPPLKREGPPKFRLSCAAYSFRDYLTGKLQPKMTLEDFVDKCAEWKLEGTELTSYYFPKGVTNEYLDSLTTRAADRGLEISGTAVGNNFCLPPGEKRNQQLAHVKQWVDHAQRMKAPTIRIFAGTPPKETPLEEALRWAGECIQDCCAYAAERGVVLGLENHGGFTSTAEGLLQVVEKLEAPAFGINLDTGNFHVADPYADMERTAPYAVSVQVKVEVSPRGGKRQETDFERVAAILRAANYQGWVALEYEAKEDPLTAVPGYLDRLRASLA